MKRKVHSEFDKYAELEEAITFEELIAKITVDNNTPTGLLGEWVSTYPNIRANVIPKRGRV